jgi:hypothetical protein
MGTTPILAAIDEEIMRLQQVKQLLGGSSVGNTAVAGAAKVVSAKKRVLSPEARKRIADAQRKRWAAQKKAKK